MREHRDPYLPFGELLKTLRKQGFRIGPDTHILVQRLLNQYAEQQDYIPTEKLRYQLAAILAHSEEEGRLFFELFDQYIQEHAYEGEESVGDGMGTIGEQKRKGRYWYALAALPVLILGLWWLLSPRCKTGKVDVFINLNKQNDGEQTIRFIMRMEDELSRPDSVMIYFGDGDSTAINTIDSIPVHHYQNPGQYEGKFIWYHNSTCTNKVQTEPFTYTVNPIRRIKQVNFSYTENGPNNWTLRNQSSLYKGEPLRAWDTLQSVSLEWRMDGRTIGRGDSLNIARSSTDTLEVQLRLTASWRDTTAVDSLTKKIYPFRKPSLPSFRSKSDYHNPDLSDMLIQPEAGTPWPFWLMLALLLSYAIYEIIRAWQRKVLLDDAPLRGPPLRQPLELDSTPLDFFQTQSFYELTRRLRRRRTGEERRTPDVPASIRRTAEAGGFPEIAWQERTHPSQYLLLVEQMSPGDHLAQLFVEISRELESRDISVEVYFYEKEPRLCWRKHRRERIPISRILAQYPDYRLLIIGEGEALLQESGSQLAEWTEVFDHWEERAWLSTRATEAWDQTEAALAQRFVVAPASQAGLESLVLQWQAEIPTQPRDWQRQQYETAPPQADNPDLITELRAYLGERGLRWLAACAWYPDVFWDLTLRLIKRLEAFEGAEEDQRPDLDELIRLFRLPWLRAGEMPRSLREALSAELPEDQANAVRELLLRVIAQPRNAPPPDSYAAADRQVRVALFQYLNSQQDREARKRLKQAIDHIEPEDIEDQLSLHELRKTSSPLLLKLPARMFRGQVPFFGMWQKWRMAMWGIPLLIGLGLAYWGTLSPDTEVFEQDRQYTAAELRLETPADSARWFMHQGYFQATDTLDTLATGFEAFKEAFRLAPKTPNLDHSYGKSGYQEGLNLYRLDSLNAAAAQFSETLRELESARPTAWLLAGIGTVSLLQNNAKTAGEIMQIPFCGEASDSSSTEVDFIINWGDGTQNDTLQITRGDVGLAMATNPDFMSLLHFRFNQSRDSTLGRILECLDRGDLIAYQLRVRTGSESSANTNGPVYITLYGTQDSLRVLLTDQANQLNRNGTFTHIIPTLRELGPIEALRLTLRDEDWQPVSDDWYVRDLRIQQTGNNNSNNFYFETWLGDRSGKWEIVAMAEDQAALSSVEINSTDCSTTNSLAPQAEALFTASPNQGCQPLEVQFSDLSINATQWRWNLGDGTQSNLQNPIHIYSQVGNYTVSLIASYDGECADTITFPDLISVSRMSVANFTYKDSSQQIDGLDDGTIVFTNTSLFSDSYSWDFGDGNVTDERDPVHQYATNETFVVTMIAIAYDGCPDTVRATIKPLNSGILHIPNAFAPLAGKQPEDEYTIFKPKGSGLAEFHIAVYTTFGDLIWESTTLEDGKPSEWWDGKVDGEISNSDVFVWKVHKAIFADGSIWKGRREGSVTLIR